MADAESGQIYVINRENYDNLGGNIEENSLYFVRELSSENDKCLSLYLGSVKQADVLDLSYDDILYDDVTKEYDIPAEYQIKGKLLMCRVPKPDINNLQNDTGGDYYRVMMWDGIKFTDCFGTPNNVHIVTELPPTSGAVLNNLYVVTTGNEGMFVFNGATYEAVSSVDLTDYATKEYVRNYVDQHDVNVDNLTITKNASNVLSGAGANIGGKTVGGVQCLSGAHIYNYYDTSNQYCNIASGQYSNAFGFDSRALADYSYANGLGIINKSTNSHIFGKFNNLSSTNVSETSDYALIIGNGSDSVNRSDCLSVDWNGNVVLYGSADANGKMNSSSGNIKSATGSTLTTIRDSITGTIQSNYVDAYLPANAHEILISNAANNYADIEDITISDISHVVNSTTLRTDDYSCVYVFVKASTTTDVRNLMTNFLSSNTTETTDGSNNPPKIFLLNSDLDITEYNVIHIFVFYDGIRVCAIVAGYYAAQFEQSQNLFGFNDNENNNSEDDDRNVYDESNGEDDTEPEVPAGDMR